MPYFEKIEGFSAQFHQIDLQGQTITTEYGKVGGTHKQSSKTFPTAQKAQIAYEKLLSEKKAKGYREPNNEAIPDERIDWTPKLIASLPIIRGIHSPPLELVLKPLVINELNDQYFDHDRQMLEDIILPWQIVIKKALDSHELLTDISLTKPIWTDYLNTLLDLSSTVHDSVWIAVRDLFGQSMEAALILLDPVTASEIFIERLYQYSLNHYGYEFKVLKEAFLLLRHQIALLPVVEYEYLLGVASRHFRQSIYYMDMVLAILFPAQQAWAEELIDKELQGHIVHAPSRSYIENRRSNNYYEAPKDLLCLFPCVCSLKHFQALYEATWHRWINPEEATLWLHLYGTDSVALFDFCIDRLKGVAGWNPKMKILLSIFLNLHTEAAVDVLIKHKDHEIVSELLSIQSRRWPDFISKKLQP